MGPSRPETLCAALCRPTDLTPSQLLVLSCAAVVPSLLLLLPALHGCVVGLGQLLAADVLPPLGQGLGLTHTGAHLQLHLPYIVRREAAIILPAVTGAYAAGGRPWVNGRGCHGQCSYEIGESMWAGQDHDRMDTVYATSAACSRSALSVLRLHLSIAMPFCPSSLSPLCAAWVLSRQFDVKVPQVVAIREAWSSSDRWGRPGGEGLLGEWGRWAGCGPSPRSFRLAIPVAMASRLPSL